MQVTIEIEPQTFSVLQRFKEKGVSLDKALRDALDRLGEESSFQKSVSAEEWSESFKGWANKLRELPDFPDDALRRESICDDRI